MSRELVPVARIRSDFADKFGVPRQAGLVDELTATVVFEPRFRDPDALRGIDGFSHLWLVWLFSLNAPDAWATTARPPRLGGNRRMGVFATRSPFRPNNLGLSCVRLLGVDLDGSQGPTLRVGGADLVDGTPIVDIKPYVGADCHPDATVGFTTLNADYRVTVEIPEHLLARVPEDRRKAMRGVLAEDPRPAYHHDPDRVYGMMFAGREVRFRVADGVLVVVDVT